MFGIGSTELLVILLVALVVLGPKSLPGIAKTLGKAMGEFRRLSTDFQRTMILEVAQEEHEKRKKEAEEELFGSGKETTIQAENTTQTPKVETKTSSVDGLSGQKIKPQQNESAVPIERPQVAPEIAPQETPLSNAVARAEAEAAATTTQKSATS